jgi:hypothetical protein
MSSVVCLRSSFERFPLFSDSPDFLTEFDQVVIAEQRLLAQSFGEGEELLEELLPPQPAASRAASATRTSASFMRLTLSPSARACITLNGRS